MQCKSEKLFFHSSYRKVNWEHLRSLLSDTIWVLHFWQWYLLQLNLQLRILCTQIEHARVKKEWPLVEQITLRRNNKALYKKRGTEKKEISHLWGVSLIEQNCVKMCNVAQRSFISNLTSVGLRQQWKPETYLLTINLLPVRSTCTCRSNVIACNYMIALLKCCEASGY